MFGTQQVPELDNQLRKLLKISGYMLVFFCLALVLYPNDSVLWGLIIGMVLGIYNSITLAKRIKQIPEISFNASSKVMKWNLTFRMGLILAVLYFVANRLPFVSILGMGAGILLPSCLLICSSVFETYKQYRQSEAYIRKY